CIVCLDACFMQKCMNNPCNCTVLNPPNPTNTVFVSAHDVKLMEEFVEEWHSKNSKKRIRATYKAEDGLEDGIWVPVSALYGCGELFVAADEKHQKVSTHFFWLIQD
ncbi:hypothetical protein PAXRUDRAFT_156422, partial [Paxillus rubicundulus Ve08.2h10]